jgi:Cof subfamily protein (haloacid dehalogenase superfamily)
MSMRLVFADMDDTFLTHDKRVGEGNLKAIERMAEAGVEFVPCSGRPVGGIPREALETPATHYAVSANGAAVNRLGADGEVEVLNTHLMATDDVLAIYDALRGHHVTFDVFVDGTAYAERWRYDHLDDYIEDPVVCASFKRMRTVIDEDVPELLAGKPGVEKVTLYWTDPADRDLTISLVEANPRLTWASSAPKNLEFSDAGATKGAGLLWLADHLGVPVADTVAFGDNLNDVTMLEAAGTGVVMANGTPEAKAAADEETLDCDHDGVGAWILRELDSEAS